MNTVFSIIIPIYNVKPYLEKCLDSVVNQTYRNIEIILVDDGSFDGSGEICDAYAKNDDRIKVIHKQNGGCNLARKVGTENATGDYIVCVDGDDWIDTRYIEKFVNIIEEYNADIICCTHFVATDNEAEEIGSRIRAGFYSSKEIEKEIFPILIYGVKEEFPIMLWAKAFRRELFITQQHEVDSRIKMGEDSACVIPCVYKASSVYVIDEPLYYYRKNLTSLTKSWKAFDWDGPRLRGEHIESQLDLTYGDFQAQLKRYVIHALFNVAVSQFNRKEKYSIIKNDIKLNLKNPYYLKALKGCKFKSLKGKLALWTLKHKAVLLMKIYNGIKY